MTKQQKATSYHEAGHVAAHLYYSIPFEYVTIVPNDTCRGHVHSNMDKKIFEIFEIGDPTAEEERYFKHEMIILMAGGAAEQKYRGIKSFPKGCENDYRSLATYCERGLGLYDKSLFYYSKFIIE